MRTHYATGIITATVNIAVIGTGNWGKRVIREIQTLSRQSRTVKLNSVVDNSRKALASCEEELGPLDYRTDYQSLLSDRDLSAVHICTPTPTHFEIASAFIKAGKNVLVEKPITLNSREAYQLVEQANAERIVLSTGHLHRFSNGLRALKSALEPRVLGEPYYLKLTWTANLPPQDHREAITELAPHPFDITNNLTGRWPSKISCTASGHRNGDNEEVAFITSEYEDGLCADIELSLLDPWERRKLRVVAEEGSVSLDCLDQRVVLFNGGRIVNMPIIPSNNLREEIRHFANCVGRNRLSQAFSNDNSGLLGAHVITCLEAARESLLEGSTVNVNFPSQYRDSIAIRYGVSPSSGYPDTGESGEAYEVEQHSPL